MRHTEGSQNWYLRDGTSHFERTITYVHSRRKNRRIAEWLFGRLFVCLGRARGPSVARFGSLSTATFRFVERFAIRFASDAAIPGNSVFVPIECSPTPIEQRLAAERVHRSRETRRLGPRSCRCDVGSCERSNSRNDKSSSRSNDNSTE